MPAWILSLIEKLTPLGSVAEGVIKIGEAVAAEIKSDDDVATKAETVVGDLAEAAHQVTTALHANTPAAAAPAETEDKA